MVETILSERPSLTWKCYRTERGLATSQQPWRCLVTLFRARISSQFGTRARTWASSCHGCTSLAPSKSERSLQVPKNIYWRSTWHRPAFSVFLMEGSQISSAATLNYKPTCQKTFLRLAWWSSATLKSNFWISRSISLSLTTMRRSRSMRSSLQKWSRWTSSQSEQ